MGLDNIFRGFFITWIFIADTMNIAYGGYSFLHEQSIIINYGVTNIYDNEYVVKMWRHWFIS